MRRSHLRHRKNNREKSWLQRLWQQLFIAIAILLLIIWIKKLNISVSNQAIETIQQQMTRDYTPADMENAAKSVFAHTKQMPQTIENAIQKSERQLAFVPPMSQGTEEVQVYAITGGTVTEITSEKEGEMTIYISHGNDRSSIYGGCNKVYVKPLERVKKGQLIASILPQSGSALDFTLRIDGKVVDPADYIAF